MGDDAGVKSGSKDLAMPEELRGPLKAHLKALKETYKGRGWAGRAGFGDRPAVIVIDLARYWLDPGQQIGSPLDAVVLATRRVLDAARAASVPIFFTSFARSSRATSAVRRSLEMRASLPDAKGDSTFLTCFIAPTVRTTSATATRKGRSRTL